MFLLLLKALLGSEVQKVACNAMEAIKTRGHSGSEDTFELKAQKLEGNKKFLIIGYSWIQGAINIIKVTPNSAYSFFIPPETYSKIVIVKKNDFQYILSFFFHTIFPWKAYQFC